ncbi:hypothetical protein HN695_00550 [Candidatus Woesearchaeota archaeon]|jgi:hypothetical protein|nr:hypothetical protein [Candidatus Woesearchaeota archaeon]MBT5271730.1 hypothetical protein [Candidatus Woesearchaeota archaeon]MBT6041591.1 hypothetical protein [Candidatus Woesearchaeota archaeon]MBT6337406.1 hypothetical protein [Candidatus Woesearchaeota archaeon]MBT7926803.1 hypothetical protein [Candidatus Woesearchaeota archaeon]
MKHKIMYILPVLASIPVALAEYGGTEEGGCFTKKGGHMIYSWGLWKLFYIIIGAFIFSVIFWLVYKWLVDGCWCQTTTKKKKKR